MPPKGKGKDAAKEEPQEDEEGEGKFIFDDGSSYEGWFRRVAQEGHEGKVVQRHTGTEPGRTGTMVEGGNVYVGQWSEDRMEGFGEFTFDSKAKYKGHWVNNRFEGTGCYLWPDGSFYEGQWRANKMHGEGTYQDVHGKRWHGRFYNGTGPGLCMEAP
eukprot:TRINITY_DN65439_c0_g1_i1.p1 TRINITY_DN65439_c0_g1~~TRINITY_DN65439_c0_g1_i1.p1  ORF type:complete len:158 (+),score=44.61 TRINITY_DN65439_c0_g1_i1:85-558(+)